ncbi:MAG TPA: single-stranded-DNA-specific exonuclease RecJ [Lachnospiraceae bacterium]|nr:single-stranded-DNA-specific exonuclease RecJ [Lachnospiraceae bacterium]
MSKWMVAAKRADFEAIGKKYRISPVLARIIRNRDVIEDRDIDRFLNGTRADLYAPGLMKDLDRAVEILRQKIAEKKQIRIIGDYDIDGICSTYILYRGLTACGAQVDSAIPHRIRDGYGLNEHLIQDAYDAGTDTVITCDNGIAAYDQIEMANALGMTVIVTDHHEVPFVMESEGKELFRRELLPPALAVIDPKQEQCHYPFPNICGGVVAYKLALALEERTGNAALRDAEEELLEFAALSTVCDVMELKGENRILVKEGLKRLNATRNPGIRALTEVNGIEPGKLSAYHLGFVIGPCLNATGRLDTAKRALELLQSRTKVEAMSAARELKELNDSRKNLTLQGVAQAESTIAGQHMEQDKVMVVFLPEVHESLAGIIAGRIREHYNHPVFLLTRGEEGVKGSGRSIEGYHMYEAMTEVKHYFTKFGGHAMAAGLSMREEDIPSFRQELNEKCRLQDADFIPKVHIDVPMPMDYADEKLVEELAMLEPFGVGNPKPLFAQKNLLFVSGYKMGANKTCARYRVQTPEGAEKQLLLFGGLEEFGSFLADKFGPGSEAALYAGRGNFRISVVYQLGKNTYQGRSEMQYVMQYYGV